MHDFCVDEAPTYPWVIGPTQPVRVGPPLKPGAPNLVMGSTCVVKRTSYHEFRVLYELAVLMAHKKLPPVFAELLDCHECIMPRYKTDLDQWVRAPGYRPLFPSRPSSAGDEWTTMPGSGWQLAGSAHATDRAIFANTLRGVLLQVLVGLDQAQRLCAFSHNDLHGGNVMMHPCGRSRMFLTAAGPFVLSAGVPEARVIDMQHGGLRPPHPPGEAYRLGYAQDIYNAMTLRYDVWRLASFLVLTTLVAVWDKVPEDIQDLLLQLSRFEGAPVSRHLDAAVHHCPFAIDGFTPLEALEHRAFDPLRCDLHTRVHAIYGDLSRPHSIAGVRPPKPQLRSAHLLIENYVGNALGRAALLTAHSDAQRRRFMYMEAVILHNAVTIYSGYPERADVLARCALLDAIICKLHHTFVWIGRPDETYNAAVRGCMLDDVPECLPMLDVGMVAWDASWTVEKWAAYMSSFAHA